MKALTNNIKNLSPQATVGIIFGLCITTAIVFGIINPTLFSS